MSLMWDLMVLVSGCRWKSTYSEILDVGLSIDETSGRPGWPSLWTLGGSFSIGVLGLLTFSPSAIFSGILCWVLNSSIVLLTVLVYSRVGLCCSF